MWVLEQLGDGQASLASYFLTSGTITLGRPLKGGGAAQADIVATDPSVSKVHTELHVSPLGPEAVSLPGSVQVIKATGGCGSAALPRKPTWAWISEPKLWHTNLRCKPVRHIRQRSAGGGSS